jgi:hypothetical protein
MSPSGGWLFRRSPISSPRDFPGKLSAIGMDRRTGLEMSRMFHVKSGDIEVADGRRASYGGWWWCFT